MIYYLVFRKWRFLCFKN